MKSTGATIILARWRDIRERVFSLDMKIAVLKNLNQLSEEDYYIDLRNTSEARLLDLIEQLGLLPTDQWSIFVNGQPLTLMSFLYDRFLYVEKYLTDLAQADVFQECPEADLLKWGLVQLWNERDINTYP